MVRTLFMAVPQRKWRAHRQRLPGLPVAGLSAMQPYFPSLSVLESNDDGRLNAGLRLSRLRPQVAVIRTLAEHFEYLSLVGRIDGVGDLLIEEMVRLARDLPEPSEPSGPSADSQRAKTEDFVRRCAAIGQ
jgi:hypothetical protein